MKPPATPVHNTEAIAARIVELGPWFHNMPVGGVQTAPEHFLGDYPMVKYIRFQDVLPRDLTGASVLDIGCNAGFYSLEMKRRGAARVVGIDTGELYLKQARFAAEVEELDVDFRQMSVWEIAALGERFDIVIFMGVFYHLRHPLLALDLIHEHVCGELLLFQSMQRGVDTILQVDSNYDITDKDVFERPGYPSLYFVEHSYSSDPTNWWVPNRACAEAMLRSAGFTILARPEDEVYLCRRNSIEVPADGPHAVYPLSRAGSP